MRELDCDFCGTAAAGAYEVGPAPPDRSPSDRRRLVLCDDCRVTLADAIEPLLDRLAAAEGETPTGERRESAGTGDQTAAPDQSDGNGSTDPLDESETAARNGTAVSGSTDDETGSGEDDDNEAAVTGRTDTESETAAVGESTEASEPTTPGEPETEP
ncbi:MAG: hypothetical protein J07HB67_01866, partial [halophilic archaeon J07HB67]